VVFFTAEPKNTGENFRETVARQNRGSEVLCGWERVVQEKIGDLVVDLGKLLDELCALLGGQPEGRGSYLIRFDDINIV
jgi:hypothetical protein